MITLPETTGDRVVKFIEGFCVHGEGDFYGMPFKLDDWQKKIIYEMYELTDRDWETLSFLGGITKSLGVITVYL